MVDNTVGDGPAPPPLILANWCGPYHLPERGGIYDQDYQTMYEMNACLNIANALRTVRSAKGKAIHNVPGNALKLHAWLREQDYI